MTAEELTIKKLKEEIKNTAFTRRIGVLKWMVMVVGSVLLFIIIQRPESILNRKSSQESINRERAKIVLDLLKTKKDPNDVLLGLAVLEKSYPETDNDWVQDMIEIFKARAETSNSIKLQETKIKYLQSQVDAMRANISRPNTAQWRELTAIKDSIADVNRKITIEKGLIEKLLRRN